MIHPAFQDYLTKPYFANPNQKGGTLIAEDVLGQEEHRLRASDPDRYRLCFCPTCNGKKMHSHGFRFRKMRGDPESTEEKVCRYKCINCSAVWTVLPAFLARHLHRSWKTVQTALVKDGVLEGTGKAHRIIVPKTTRRRWAARLHSSARVLLQILSGIGAGIGSVLRKLSRECTRLELLEELARQGLLRAGHKLAELAAWLHRAVMGVRLM
jgi:hypothetical protein